MLHGFDFISIRLFQMVRLRLNDAAASCLQYFLEASKSLSLQESFFQFGSQPLKEPYLGGRE